MKYDNDFGHDVPRWRGLGVEVEIIYLCPTTIILIHPLPPPAARDIQIPIIWK
jgi:hypothetical protein